MLSSSPENDLPWNFFVKNIFLGMCLLFETKEHVLRSTLKPIQGCSGNILPYLCLETTVLGFQINSLVFSGQAGRKQIVEIIFLWILLCLAQDTCGPVST